MLSSYVYLVELFFLAEEKKYKTCLSFTNRCWFQINWSAKTVSTCGLEKYYTHEILQLYMILRPSKVFYAFSLTVLSKETKQTLSDYWHMFGKGTVLPVRMHSIGVARVFVEQFWFHKTKWKNHYSYYSCVGGREFHSFSLNHL